MPYAAPWTPREIVTLSEADQTEEEKYRTMSLTRGI